MLEVNDFTAIRISLASPEQIKSWSYGEVVKPETINYRTLKPEKDGLFCEKIFGPTKDFECFCGKYKRVRYKGIICDKCGVEVTRSKVRRERMGHIELASPVGHIWFVKGTPSRLSLLLDVSPRNLERIIYFAQFLVTAVDTDMRARLLQEAQENYDQQIAALEEKVLDQSEDVRAQLRDQLDALMERRQEIVGRAAAQKESAIAELTARAAEVELTLKDPSGPAAPKDITFTDKVVVPQGAPVEESYVSDLHKLLDAKLTELDVEHHLRLQDELLKIDAERETLERHTSQAVETLRHPVVDEKAKLEEALERYQDDLDSLKPLALLSEAKYRELKDKYGPMFTARMGAEAVLQCLSTIDLDELRRQLQREVETTAGQRRKKATKRLRVVEAFRKSGNKPDWMILTVLPVLPPDLRPMVQLDGGRFATSDLNDLYRRVINRNNRLRRLLELGAPEIIIRNEKRMLQEAVDSLIDNGRRGRAVAGNGNHRLKSLSDMLKGKQGRFRQNLLGKRVDYSGRSVIVVGPELQLHQCGLPKRMALELFKPFVMRKLVEQGQAHNIKSAKRIVERARPEVWDVLEEVIKDRPVLLNRAPTLHRLGIQAFMPILVEGSAIQIHPLVCSAFNADFDGDQMAVHVPLSKYAVEEAKKLMLSTNNLLSPSSGEPIVAPTLDMVLGCYYMTLIRPGAKGEGRAFSNFEEAKMAYDLGQIDLQAQIKVRLHDHGGVVETSIGRLLFNEVLPEELGFRNALIDKKAIKQIVADCYRSMGNEPTAQVVDNLKTVGFIYATKSGITIAANDLDVPIPKAEILADAEQQISQIEAQFRRGLITEEERYAAAIAIWQQASDTIADVLPKALDPFGPLAMMANSGAKGNIAQIRQMTGMRGLMSDPSGRIIELPIKASFREGLSVLEYFISTHGARKGLADTALRTADSGYLTRRLIDVSQDVIVNEEDCGSNSGIWIEDQSERGVMEPFTVRIIGRVPSEPVVHPETGEIIVDRNEVVDIEKGDAILAAGIKRIFVRSPHTCLAHRGICKHCYGWSLATGRMVNFGEAVGIIAAQSIGEPGTQLTMRTFHTGGIAGLVDITSGLPRVEELFEARVPKGLAVVSEIDGMVEIIRNDEGSRRVRIVSTEVYRDEYALQPGWNLLVTDGQLVDAGAVLAEQPAAPAAEAPNEELSLDSPAGEQRVVARIAGKVQVEGSQIGIYYEEKEEREYMVPASAQIRVSDSERIRAGDQLTEGVVNPQDLLRILGREAAQAYIVDEVQKVYRSQGVTINDKHIEVIVRQMLRKVRIDSPGDTSMLPGELVDRFFYEDMNAQVLAEGGEPATAETVLLGVTKASLNTESFLAAASFQDTTRVLTEAAINGSIDRLMGLKENVIIGKLIPAQALHFDEPPEEEADLLGPPPFPSRDGALLQDDDEPSDALDDLDEEGDDDDLDLESEELEEELTTA